MAALKYYLSSSQKYRHGFPHMENLVELETEFLYDSGNCYMFTTIIDHTKHLEAGHWSTIEVLMPRECCAVSYHYGV